MVRLLFCELAEGGFIELKTLGRFRSTSCLGRFCCRAILGRTRQKARSPGAVRRVGARGDQGTDASQSASGDVEPRTSRTQTPCGSWPGC